MPSKQPTKDEIKTALHELKEKGFKIDKEIGEGSYGKVYKAFYNGKPLVIKIIKARRASRQRSKLIHTQFKKTLQKLGEEYTQYFTEDRYEESSDGSLLFQYMEYLEGQDLLEYFENNGSDITFENLLKIICGLLHALYFFHSAGVIFNDLKLENVFINPKTLDITMIDYTDSSSGCNKKQCSITKDTVKTYTNPYRDDTTKEDIWRLCLLWMDCITSIINLKEDRIFDTLNYFSENVSDALDDSHSYPTELIQDDLKECFRSFEKLFPHHIVQISELYKVSVKMMDKYPENRPSIVQLFSIKPFSSVCSKKVVRNKQREMDKQIIKIKFRPREEFKHHIQTKSLKTRKEKGRHHSKTKSKRRKSL